MAEKFHILDFPEDSQLDEKEFSKLAEQAADLTEDYAFYANLDALNTLLETASPTPKKTLEASSQAASIAKDTLQQTSMMIDEVQRFKSLSKKIAKHS
ncbi:hypothetical protein WH95_13780 [Kiloniella litopenaei]|uniref:Uncharacterized protein n=1 Tax=Kiloniella litopenaei TaxID=1549748 RepID=A0A0M2R3Q2_9PROT|nr:hypothetical protein [Kiloniella litopenaei]KKJ76286.1 hypothetical protein WH95_13780 [Kiloniella litopenaei]